MLPDDFKVGTHTAHNKCHVHEYADLTASMKCTLWQDDEERGFLDVSKPAKLKVKFCLEGNLRYHLCGTICACLHVECFGKGPEKTLDCIEKEITDGVACKDECLEFEFDIPAYYFKPGEEGCGQVCCFVVTATSKDRCGNPGHIGCWCKLCVMLHDAPDHT